MLDTQYMTTSDVARVLRLLRELNASLAPCNGAAGVSLANHMVLCDSNGETLGSIEYNSDAAEHVFHYPATTIRGQRGQ